jgi:N-acyl-D-aspartate/D-glutamate deacylase
MATFLEDEARRLNLLHSTHALSLAIRNGTIYDGNGSPPFVGEVRIENDVIVAVGPPSLVRAEVELDASGLAVSPGFINMLSWATESLIEDGDSQSDIRQGVTLEVFGEGRSMGPLSPAMKRTLRERQTDIQYEITWTSLGGYLDWLVGRGVSTNVASFVGATTVRISELGYEDRAPTPDELEAMCQLVRQSMREGALGVGSSLIYAPAFYASTDELVALVAAAADFGGIYISHIRGEGARLLESIDELIENARRANAPAEIYHLKALGQTNWSRLCAAIDRVEAARAEGLAITADMCTYAASSTGLDATMPPWVQEGGHHGASWNLANGHDHRSGHRRRQPCRGGVLRHVRGQRPRTNCPSVDELWIRRTVARSQRRVLADTPTSARIRNIRPPPRSLRARPAGYPPRDGDFAIDLAAGAQSWHRAPWQARAGLLRGCGCFDPSAINDRATFDRPHQYAAGVEHVVVNGELVLRNGEHTHARPGRVVRRARATHKSAAAALRSDS